MKNRPLVVVVWRDASRLDPVWLEQVPTGPLSSQVVSTGFLVRKDKNEIVLASGIAEDGQMKSLFVIPAVWASSIKYLRMSKFK